MRWHSIECRLMEEGEILATNNRVLSMQCMHSCWRDCLASLQAKASSSQWSLLHVPLDFLRRLYVNDDLLLVEFCNHILSGHVPRRRSLWSPLSIAHVDPQFPRDRFCPRTRSSAVAQLQIKTLAIPRHKFGLGVAFANWDSAFEACFEAGFEHRKLPVKTTESYIHLEFLVYSLLCLVIIKSGKYTRRGCRGKQLRQFRFWIP
jgi:hypothetical protein